MGYQEDLQAQMNRIMQNKQTTQQNNSKELYNAQLQEQINRIRGVAQPTQSVATQPAPTQPIGQYGAGNINLYNRPIVNNPDGTTSTVRSMSFSDGKNEILIPTVVNGKIVSNDEAIDNYYKTGEYLGKFNTVDEANAYAENLHKQQEKLYSHSQKSKQGLQQAQEKIHATEKPMTAKLQSGQALTPEETIRYAQEQGIAQDKIDKAKKNLEYNSGLKVSGKIEDEIKDNNLLNEVNSKKYFEYQDKLDEAKATGNIKDEITYQSLLDQMDSAYKPMTKDWYNIQKPDTDFLLGQIEQRVYDVRRDEKALTEAKTYEEQVKTAEEYNKTYQRYQDAVKRYQDALLYEKYNNNPVLDQLDILAYTGANSLANQIEGLGRDARNNNETLRGVGYSNIKPAELIKYNNELKNGNERYALINSPLVLNALKYQAEKKDAGERIKELYSQIASGTFTGTEEDIKKIIDEENDRQNKFQRREEIEGQLQRKKEKFDWKYEPSPLAKNVLSATEEVAGMIPTLGATALNPAFGDLAMYQLSGNQAYNRARANGATVEQAEANKTLKGSAEAAFEHLVTSSIDAAVGRTGLLAPSEWAGQIANPVLRTGVGLTVDAVGEGLEEIPSTVLDPIIDRITYNPNAPLATKEEIWGSFAGSILPTLMLSGTGLAIQGIETYATNATNRVNNSNLTDLQKAELINQIENGRKEFIKQINERKDEIDAQTTNTANSLTNNPIARDVEALNMQPAQNNSQITSQNATIASKVAELNKRGFNIPQSTANTLQAIQDVRGTRIEFDDTIDGNGVYDAKNRTIYLNPTQHARAIEFTIAHELGHDIKAGNLEDYNKLQKAVLDYAGKQQGFTEGMKALDNTYRSKLGEGNYDINDEMTNDILGEVLGNQEFLDSLAQKQPNLFQKVWNWIKNVLIDNTNGRLSFEERRMLNKYEQGFRNAYQKAFNGTQQNNNQLYNSIETLPDGKRFSKATRQVIKGNNPDLWGQQIEDYINEEIRHGKDVTVYGEDGDLLTITRDTAGKAKFRNTIEEQSQKRQMTDNELKAKYEAEAQIDELAEISRRGKKNVPDRKNHPFAKDGFNYRTAYFEDSNGQYYELKISTGLNGEIKTIYNVGQMQKRNHPLLNGSSSQGGARRMVSNKSIPQTQHNVNIQHSLSEKETDDRTLAATHNLTEWKLRGVLELGGFPVPSIAISDVNKLTPTQFGDITVLFDKDTIDPADRRNEVYDRDVWSPTFPQVEFDVTNEDIRNNVTKGFLEKEDTNDPIISEIIPRYLYADNLKGFLNSAGIEDTLNRIKDDKAMQYFYLKKYSGQDFQAITEQADFSNSNDYGNQELQTFLDEYTGKPLSDLTQAEELELGETISNIILKSHEKDIAEMQQNNKYGDDFKNNFIKYYEDIANQYKNNYGKIDQFIYSANKLKNAGEDTKTINKEATYNEVEKRLNKREYDNWVDSTFGKIFENAKKGIRNNKDTFTPTGNRRSFTQLHDDYNLDNLVKNLTRGQTKAGEGAIFGGGFGDVQAMAADRFNSIEDIRNAKNRLTTSQEANQLLAPTKEEIKDRIDELSKYSKNDGNWFGIGMGAWDRASDAITEFAGRKNLTVNELKKVLKKYPTFDISTIPNDVLQNTVDSVKKLKEIYTDYFEAKPQRAVGFEEIASVLIPNNLAEDTKQQLRDRGINYVEYDPTIEGDREAKYKEAAQDVLFSKSNNTWQQFLDDTYGKWNTGTRTNFESLPSNEELQQQGRKSIENEPLAKMSTTNSLENMRDFKGVGNRKINAYQYDNPEVKPFFQHEARNMLQDLNNAVKGERTATWNDYGELRYTGVTRETTQDIADLLDGNNGAKLSYEDIRKGLNAIINDKGSENIAAAKRIEMVLDKRLREGYTDSYGTNYEANENYLNFLAGKDFIDPAEYERQVAERMATEDGTLFSLSEEQQNEVNDYISKLNNDTTIDDNFKDQILTRFDNLTDYKQFENIKQDVEDYKEKAYQGIKSLVDVANMSEDNVRQRPMEYTQLKDKNTSNQRRFFDNAETSNIIAEETKSRYNATTYEQKANLDTLEQVRQKLDERGNDMVEEWKHKTKNFTDKDVALGAILIERYQQAGDWNSAARAIEKLADMGTEAGRAVQMYSIFQRLSPETMALYQQKELDKAFEETKQRKTGKWVEANKDKYKLTAEDTQFIYDQVEKASQAIDEETKQRELSKIENRINDKLPPEDGQTIKALRRIAMLFNPKTQVRNIVGNTLIMPVNDIADVIGAGIDRIVARKTGTRTTGLPNPITKAKGFAKGVKSAVTDYKTGTRTTGSGSKYEFDIGAKPFNENTDSKVKNAINNKLNGINNLLSAVMSGGDRPFYEAAYKNSLESQMKANKVKEPTQDMIDIAVNEALQRTWNDNNEYTKAVLGIRSAMNKINIKGFGLGDLIVPFAKTPANLTKAMVEYSPAGFIPAISNYVDMSRAISRGEMTPQQQKKFVSSMSKAIAGSILYAIAGSLVKAGKITGSADDDKDVKNFEQNVLGIQPYSVRLGDKTYTYSWANPINAPLAIMADTYKMSKENASLYDTLFNAVKVAGNVLLDNSFLQGISDIFTHQEGPVAGIIESIMSMPESMIPTFLSQIASLGDDTQRQTYEYKNKGQSVINRVKNKIPGARNTLEPKVNTFGEEIENQNNLFNAFLNPANVREARTTEAQKEIYSLYEATGDKTIFPMQAPNSVTKNGENTNLTNAQKNRYQKGSGQYATEVYGDLFDSDYYDSINNTQKTDLLQRVAQDANKMGKTEVGVWTEDTFKVDERYNDLEDMGIPLADYYIAWSAQKDVVSDKDANGKTITLSASRKKKEAIDDAVDNLNKKQMEYLYGIFDISEKVW